MLHLLWSSLLRIWGWLSHLWILTPNWRHENDYRLLFALKTCTVNLDSSKLTQGSLSPWLQGQGKWGNKSSAVPGHHASMVNPPANKLGEGNNLLMHKQRRKDFRRLKSTQDLENTNPDFQNRVVILRPTQRKGAHSDKLIVTLLWRWCKEFHLWLITN